VSLCCGSGTGAGAVASMADLSFDKNIEAHASPAPADVRHNLRPGTVLDESDFVTITEDRDLRRGLHQRHVSLIAIAGAIVGLS
jgi:amino acid permease